MATRLAIAALLLLASASSAAAGEEGTEKVAVALYYESLCPYSARFVVKHLAKVFVDGLLEVVDLTLVPYGNARIHAGGVISCQVVHRPIRSLLAFPCATSSGIVVLDLASWAACWSRVLLLFMIAPNRVYGRLVVLNWGCAACFPVLQAKLITGEKN